jgi:hypothetical protein
MIMLIVFIISMLTAVMVYCVVALARNEWVYRTRTRWISEDVDKYRRAQSYRDMMRFSQFLNWSDKMDDWKK